MDGFIYMDNIYFHRYYGTHDSGVVISDDLPSTGYTDSEFKDVANTL